jgi:TPR repeat protein
MKNTRFAVTAAFALLVMLPPVFGQSAGIRVDVPFKFAVGNTTLAAGEYKVSVMKPGMLQIQRTDGRSSTQGMVEEITAGRALTVLSQKAEGGDKEAQYRLAIAYEKGRGLERNYPEAVKWYLRSAERGWPAAEYKLGLMHQNGDGITKDPTQAIHWYRQAAEQNYALAENKLGVIYTEGRGVAPDYGLAFQWFRRAANHGLSTAYHGLGSLYLYGVRELVGTLRRLRRCSPRRLNAV